MSEATRTLALVIKHHKQVQASAPDQITATVLTAIDEIIDFAAGLEIENAELRASLAALNAIRKSQS